MFFGRTMDFSYPLDPGLYYVPKGYAWVNQLKTHEIRNRYSFFGIGQDIAPLVFADGVNENGFAAAALYFPGYADYDPVIPDPSRLCVSAIELVGFLLGQCSCAEQAAALLPTINIVGTQDSVTGTVAPLHWILADRDGACMTVEKTKDGLQIMDNPVGVLSNSPDFNWHLTNLRNYGNLSSAQWQEAKWETVRLTPFGQGGGSFGLPGDFTPPSRFVRAAWLKSCITPPADSREAVGACFHILENVSIPKGIVITSRETADYTQYTAFIDLDSRTYYSRPMKTVRFVKNGFRHIPAAPLRYSPLGNYPRRKPLHLKMTGYPKQIRVHKNIINFDKAGFRR